MQMFVQTKLAYYISNETKSLDFSEKKSFLKAKYFYSTISLYNAKMKKNESKEHLKLQRDGMGVERKSVLHLNTYYE